MKLKSGILFLGVIGLNIALAGCGGPPTPSLANCSGRGLEVALSNFRGDEVSRQAYIDKCDQGNAAEGK